MDELVGVGLEGVVSVIDFLRGSAVATLAVLPCVTLVGEADIAAFCIEVGKRILATGILRTVEAATTHQRREAGNGYAIKLMVHDVA